MASPRLDIDIVNDSSSFVRGIAYDPKKETLQLKLSSGTYRYYGVPALTFAMLITSPSDGKAYNKLIKGQGFRSRKMKVANDPLTDIVGG